MSRNRWAAVAITACAACGYDSSNVEGTSRTVAGASAALDSGHESDSVSYWDKVAMDASLSAGEGNAAATISLAMVHAAIFDAVNSIDRSYRPYLAMVAASSHASKDAAVAASAYGVLLNLYPLQKDALTDLYDVFTAAITGGESNVNEGIEVGTQAAKNLVAARTNDGRNAYGCIDGTAPPTCELYSYLIAAPGVYEETPPVATTGKPPNSPNVPGTGYVAPFVVTDVAALAHPRPSPDLSAQQWRDDYAEVMAMGAIDSAARTPEQTEIALFWIDGLRLWTRGMRDIAADHGLEVVDSARFFAQILLGAADGAIVCWRSKYDHNFWRPVTAIRWYAANPDPDLAASASWAPLANTPRHPEFPSAHGCISGAITNGLRSFFGSDDVAFSLTSAQTHTTHTYQRFSDALAEIADARVWAGFHFRGSTTAGGQIGAKSAEAAAQRFQPAVSN